MTNHFIVTDEKFLMIHAYFLLSASSIVRQLSSYIRDNNIWDFQRICKNTKNIKNQILIFDVWKCYWSHEQCSQTINSNSKGTQVDKRWRCKSLLKRTLIYLSFALICSLSTSCHFRIWSIGEIILTHWLVEEVYRSKLGIQPSDLRNFEEHFGKRNSAFCEIVFCRKTRNKCLKCRQIIILDSLMVEPNTGKCKRKKKTISVNEMSFFVQIFFFGLVKWNDPAMCIMRKSMSVWIMASIGSILCLWYENEFHFICSILSEYFEHCIINFLCFVLISLIWK